MQNRLISCILLMLCATKIFAQDDGQIRQYIDQYRGLAIAEQRRSGIPAAITLAQGIHETVAGTSELATQANNHFGIKCKKEWTGATFAHTDDAPNECFRKYGKAEDSYHDHSEYLSKSPRYNSLFKLRVTDYAGWAVGLKRCGYATNPRYAQVLIKLIQDYNLQEYTYAAIGEGAVNNYATNAEVIPAHDAPVKTEVAAPVITAENNTVLAAAPAAGSTAPVTPPVDEPSATDGVTLRKNIVVTEDENTPPPVLPPYGQVVRVNGLKAVYAKKGDMPLEYAIRNNLRYERLLEINEIEEKPLPVDMFLYLERKNARGIRATHTVKYGENMTLVAQAEGVQVKNLRYLNLLEANEEPQVGVILELQKPAIAKPAVQKPAEPVQAAASPVVEEDNKTTVAAAPASQDVTAPAVVTPAPDVTPASEQTAALDVDVPAPRAEANPVATADVKPAEPAPQNLPAVDTTTPAVTAVISTNKDIPVPPVETPKAPDQQPAIVATETTPSAATAVPAETVPATTTEVKTPVKVVGPPSSPNDIPAKPVEVPKQTAQIAVAQPEPPKQEEPKSELDLIKSRFDKVVYSKPAPKAVDSTPKEQPKPEAVAAPEPKKEIITAATAAATSHVKMYTVKKGDTAFSIAKSHNITMRQLMDWNNLDFADVKLGQKLRVQP